MHQVFRIRGGYNLHVIHETRTGANRINNVYVLCRQEPVSGERDKGTATCPDCQNLDNPCEMSPYEKNIIVDLSANAPPLGSGREFEAARARLLKRDFIDNNGKLTRRGKIVALDWSTRPAPAASIRGVIHDRHPCSSFAKCDGTGVLDGFDRMSVDRYAKLRALDLHVTCIACLRFMV